MIYLLAVIPIAAVLFALGDFLINGPGGDGSSFDNTELDEDEDEDDQ